ncbi:MAG TPA: isoprenylcysteine carboxylmethyltransferase family protein [Candidatus Methanoperedens sp.]
MNVIITFVVYFLFFSVIYSILATEYIKKKAEKWMGNKFRFYRLAYNILSFFMFAPAFLIWITYTNSTPPVYAIPQLFYPIIILIRLLAIGMFAYAALQTDFLDFIGIRQLQGKVKNNLITSGAYAMVRHPLYTGGIVLLFTKMEMSQIDLTAIALISIYLIIRAFVEERRLLALFGEEYSAYQQQVSMFIPVKWVRKVTSRI